MTRKKAQQSEFTKVLIYSDGVNKKLEKLKEIYKEDRAKARVIFEEEKKKQYNPYGTLMVYSFEYSNGDFRIVTFQDTVSFSKNNIMYHRDGSSKTLTLIYKKATNSFYSTRGKMFVPLTYTVFTQNFGNDVKSYMFNKFGWLRNVDDTTVSHYLTLTNIAKKKLFSKEKLIKHVWGVNHHLAKKLNEINLTLNMRHDFMFFWRENKHLMINLDKLNVEFFKNHLTYDTFRFARMFNEKINCGWSPKKLASVHDKLYKKYIDIVLEFEPLYKLCIREVYKCFSEFTGFDMLLTNHDLINEGKKQNHCVGTYVSKVNEGSCAIYVIGGYTLEVNFSKKYLFKEMKESQYCLRYGQCRGYRNEDAPQELKDVINEAINNFNNTIVKENYDSFVKDMNNNGKESIDDFFALEREHNDLPF